MPRKERCSFHCASSSYLSASCVSSVFRAAAVVPGFSLIFQAGRAGSPNRHIASATDVQQAYALGQRAVELALEGRNAVMPTIERISDAPYRWRIGSAPLAQVANIEKTMPREFINADGFGITDACRTYLLPLIEGEDYPAYRGGLPVYATLRNQLIEHKLAPFELA